MKRLMLLFILLPSLVSAAPVVTSTSGTLTDGAAVTIIGAGFGLHPDYNTGTPYLPLIWDKFETGSLSSGWSGGLGITLDTTTTRLNSAYSAGQVRGSGKDSALVALGDTTQDTTYISTWRYFTGFDTVTSTNSKAWRIWPDAGLDNWVMIFLGGPANAKNGDWMWLIEYVGGSGSSSFGAGFLNSWHHYEVLVDQSNNNVTVWFDGVVSGSHTQTSWGGYNPNRIVIDAYSHETDNPFTYTDDAYISHTQARAMLCDGSTWLTRGQCEIQPPTAWSDTSVTIDFNQGAYTNGATPYLYVVDSSGAASSGLGVAIGSAPQAPLCTITPL